MRCPRCHREIPERSTFCPGCGTPLALRDEPEPGRLDEPVAIDRRGGGPSRADPAATTAVVPPAPGGQPGSAARREPAAPREEPAAQVGERSQWEIGAPAAKAAPEGPEEGGPTRPVEAPPSPRPSPPGAPGGEEHAGERAADPQREGGREIHARRPPGWRRAAAWAIDGGPFVAAAVLLARRFVGEASAALPAPGTGFLGLLDLVARERVIVLSVATAAVLALYVYATLAHALAGSTLGKRILDLRVVCKDGRRPSLGRSAARSGLAVASGVLLGLGFLLALFTRSGRALHDILARTWVVEVP